MSGTPSDRRLHHRCMHQANCFSSDRKGSKTSLHVVSSASPAEQRFNLDLGSISSAGRPLFNLVRYRHAPSIARRAKHARRARRAINFVERRTLRDSPKNGLGSPQPLKTLCHSPISSVVAALFFPFLPVQSLVRPRFLSAKSFA